MFTGKENPSSAPLPPVSVELSAREMEQTPSYKYPKGDIRWCDQSALDFGKYRIPLAQKRPVLLVRHNSGIWTVLPCTRVKKNKFFIAHGCRVDWSIKKPKSEISYVSDLPERVSYELLTVLVDKKNVLGYLTQNGKEEFHKWVRERYLKKEPGKVPFFNWVEWVFNALK